MILQALFYCLSRTKNNFFSLKRVSKYVHAECLSLQNIISIKVSLFFSLKTYKSVAILSKNYF